MVWQTIDLLQLEINQQPYLLFVFFATICSYNFHWYLSRHSSSEQVRSRWTRKHARLQLLLMVIGTAGICWFVFPLREYWLELFIAVQLTFLYTAPKIPVQQVNVLKRIAIGKTLFLTFVWTYVTTVLPVLLDKSPMTTPAFLFILQRFFLIYAICVLFDYRDRRQDRAEGIKSLITMLPAHKISVIFYTSLVIFFLSACLLGLYGFSILDIVFILIPGIITWFIYPYARKNSSDYLYYGVLDGLMMASALFTSFPSF